MSDRLYLDSSAILRPVLELGFDPDVETVIGRAEILLTSRLSLIETARIFLKARHLGEVSESSIADAERWVRGLWRRCEVWEMSREVCDLAETIAPKTVLRSLDAIHLATFVLGRREIADLRLLTADKRLRDAAGTI